VRLAYVYPILLCPAYVSFAGYVLPSSPSPCGGLSPPPITMLDTTPTQPEFLHVSFGSPSWFCDILRVTPSPVSGFPLRASISSSHICAQELNGPPKFLCASLHTCHGLRTPPVLHILAYYGWSCFAFGHVTTLGNRNRLISERYQHFRERGLPCGLYDSLCTLHLFCSPLH